MGNELQVMGLNIAICDDEKVIREQIKELAEKEMPDVCAGLYETGDALLAAGKQFDIVFLDIQMEGTDGIETAKRLRQRDEDTILIYITIRSFKAKNMYFIEIENSFDGVALFHKESGLPISTKKDKEVHGIGLKNIRKCAVKYGGDLDCIVKGSKFTLSVMVKS